MNELTELIQTNPDPRELKRAVAVQMVFQQYTCFEIRDVLQVSVGFVSKWKQVFEQQGVVGLRLQHRGSTPYLDAQQRQAVTDWLQQKNNWNLSELTWLTDKTRFVLQAALREPGLELEIGSMRGG
ncbi:MAG: hypothetical protein C4287_23525 [Leptolyngbya sp. ERB_1_2]